MECWRKERGGGTEIGIPAPLQEFRRDNKIRKCYGRAGRAPVQPQPRSASLAHYLPCSSSSRGSKDDEFECEEVTVWGGGIGAREENGDGAEAGGGTSGGGRRFIASGGDDGAVEG
jgi:hypothetical protein